MARTNISKIEVIDAYRKGHKAVGDAAKYLGVPKDVVQEIWDQLAAKVYALVERGESSEEIEEETGVPLESVVAYRGHHTRGHQDLPFTRPREVPTFQIGRAYDRQRDIHDEFGGQQQGGISTPKDQPYIFLFTGEAGAKHGYDDGWGADGIFLYTGEGQSGDMTFERGNRAIRDHLQDGKDILLFSSLGKGQGYRYEGSFACASWQIKKGPDTAGSLRDMIIFHLAPCDGLPDEPTNISSETSLDELRNRAILASRATAQSSAKESMTLYRERSAAVRSYVLARALGRCEACGNEAPFQRHDGTPYLEPHHIMRLADGGPDHPQFVGAVCPNCHREIHYGKNGEELNRYLRDRVAEIEE